MPRAAASDFSFVKLSTACDVQFPTSYTCKLTNREMTNPTTPITSPYTTSTRHNGTSNLLTVCELIQPPGWDTPILPDRASLRRQELRSTCLITRQATSVNQAHPPQA